MNVVFRSPVVGGPAFAPRVSGPLALPTNQDELDAALFGILPSAKTEIAKTYMSDGTPLISNETIREDGGLLRVDLPDLDATTTRYFWTVVPVGIRVNDGGTFEYWDTDIPQDACQAGRMATFGKQSHAAITTAGSPFVSGLTPKGRLLAQAGRKTGRLLDSAHRLEAGRRRHPVRGAVVAREVPLAQARSRRARTQRPQC